MGLHCERIDIPNRFVCLSDDRVLPIVGFLDAWEQPIEDPEMAEMVVVGSPGQIIRVVIWSVPKVVLH